MANISAFLPAAAILLAGYLIGSIPFGFIIGKLHGIDIRKVGSGNIGATNVTRSVGKVAGKICFALDFCKGFLPVLALKMLVARGVIAPVMYGMGEALVILAVVLGHMFTIYLKFKGGKGIAAALGGIAGIAPLPAAAAFIVWLAVFKISGYVSLGSIIAAAALPVLVWLFGALKITAQVKLPMLIFFVVLAVAAIWAHRSNIKRLINGTENSFKKQDNE